MSQYWKENSIAIDDNDNIIYLESAPKCHDEPIVIKINSCDSPNPKVHYRRKLTIKECESFRDMLTDIIIHQKKMQSCE